MHYLLDNYHQIENVIQRQVLIQVVINMVKDAKYSALNFMKFFVNSLINEPVALIREACMNEVLLFLSYLKTQDIERVSIKLWDIFVDKVKSTQDASVLRGYVTKLYSLLNNETNIAKAKQILLSNAIGSYQLNQVDKY